MHDVLCDFFGECNNIEPIKRNILMLKYKLESSVWKKVDLQEVVGTYELIIYSRVVN